MVFRLDDAPFTRSQRHQPSTSANPTITAGVHQRKSSIKYIISNTSPPNNFHTAPLINIPPVSYTQRYDYTNDSPISLAPSLSPTQYQYQSQPSTASTSTTFEITDPFPRPQRTTTTTRRRSIPNRIPSAYSQYIFESNENETGKGKGKLNYGMPYRSSALTASTSDEQLRRESQDLSESQRYRYNKRSSIIMREASEESRRSSSEVDLNLSVDESSLGGHDDYVRTTESHFNNRLKDSGSGSGRGEDYDSILSPRVDYEERAMNTRSSSGGGLRQAYREAEMTIAVPERSLRHAISNDTTLRFDTLQHNSSYRAPPAQPREHAYNPSEAFSSPRSEIMDAIGYYDDDARAFGDVSLADQHKRALANEAAERQMIEDKEIQEGRRAKRTSWQESTTSSSNYLSNRSTNRLFSPPDGYSSSTSMTSPSLMHDTPSTSTMEDELMDSTTSPRSRMHFAKSRLQQNFREHSNEALVMASEEVSYDEDDRIVGNDALSGLGLNLGNEERSYDGSQGSRPYHRPLRLSYTAMGTPLDTPTLALRSPTPPPPHRRSGSLATSFDSSLDHSHSPSRSLSAIYSQPSHNRHTIDITIQPSTPPPPRPRQPSAIPYATYLEPYPSSPPIPSTSQHHPDFSPSASSATTISPSNSFDTKESKTSSGQSKKRRGIRAPSFNFIPAPLQLVSRFYQHRRSTTVLSLPSRSPAAPPAPRSPPSAPLLSPTRPSTHHSIRNVYPSSASARPKLSISSKIDKTPPAKLLFILGFLLGPWAWLVGGWLLKSSRRPKRREGATKSEERLWQIGRLYRRKVLAKREKELAALRVVPTHDVTILMDKEKIEVPAESEPRVEGEEENERWVTINRIAAGASSVVSFPIVGWALWAAVTGS